VIATLGLWECLRERDKAEGRPRVSPEAVTNHRPTRLRVSEGNTGSDEMGGGQVTLDVPGIGERGPNG
jgi:hypothetical protein